MLEVLTFEIWILQTTSDGETNKKKVVDLKKLYNFEIDNFFIWIHLWSQILSLKLDQNEEDEFAKPTVLMDRCFHC